FGIARRAIPRSPVARFVPAEDNSGAAPVTAAASSAGNLQNIPDDVRAIRPESLADALRRGHPEALQALSPFAACLMPMLAALDWQGAPRHVVEALPHFAA